MGTFLDSTGAGEATAPRFTGTNLSRYNNALVASFGLGDPVSSEEAVSDLSQLPMASLKQTSVTFGATGIVGTGTSATLVTASRLRANAACEPFQNDAFTISYWFKSSVAGATADIWAWYIPGSSTNRIFFNYNNSSGTFILYSINVAHTLFTLPTNYATDVGDGTLHHFVVRYRAGDFDCFFDGVKKTTVTTTWTANPRGSAGMSFDFGTANSLAGSYQHLYLFGAGLTDDACTELYNSGSGRFADGT